MSRLSVQLLRPEAETLCTAIYIYGFQDHQETQSIHSSPSTRTSTAFNYGEIFFQIRSRSSHLKSSILLYAPITDLCSCSGFTRCSKPPVLLALTASLQTLIRNQVTRSSEYSLRLARSVGIHRCLPTYLVRSALISLADINSAYALFPCITFPLPFNVQCSLMPKTQYPILHLQIPREVPRLLSIPSSVGYSYVMLLLRYRRIRSPMKYMKDPKGVGKQYAQWKYVILTWRAVDEACEELLSNRYLFLSLGFWVISYKNPVYQGMFSSSMGANDFKPLHVEQNSPGAFHVLFKSL